MRGVWFYIYELNDYKAEIEISVRTIYPHIIYKTF